MTTQQIQELKSCPYCGSSSVVYSEQFKNIRCNNCWVRTEPGSYEKCKATWNTRHPDAALAQKQKLKDATQEINRLMIVAGEALSEQTKAEQRISLIIRELKRIQNNKDEEFSAFDGFEECLLEISKIVNKYEVPPVPACERNEVIEEFKQELIKYIAEGAQPDFLIPFIETYSLKSSPGKECEVEDSCGCVFKDLDVPCKDKDCKICDLVVLPKEVVDGLEVALRNLFAMVQGECPSLLEGDHHFDQITDALSKLTEAQEGKPHE